MTSGSGKLRFTGGHEIERLALFVICEPGVEDLIDPFYAFGQESGFLQKTCRGADR